VIVIQLLSGTKNYYIAGLVPLFPTFALISHYIVGTERTTSELKETVLFGMFSLFPYLVYLIALYFFVDRCKLVLALFAAASLWLVAAAMLVVFWSRVVDF
jgi:membrane protein GlpM